MKIRYMGTEEMATVIIFAFVNDFLAARASGLQWYTIAMELTDSIAAKHRFARFAAMANVWRKMLG